MTLEVTLTQGAAALGLDLPERDKCKLLDYIELIGKWNRVYNLTSIREPEKILTHHILDSLAVVPHIPAQSILDVGSGAGLPGIPVAVALPESEVTLLDSNQKKCAFLNQVVIELALPNVKVVCARVENWNSSSRFDLAISRAFSELQEFVAVAARLCKPGGALVAMKGAEPVAEVRLLPDAYRMSRLTRLKVPGLEAQRHLVFLRAA